MIYSKFDSFFADFNAVQVDWLRLLWIHLPSLLRLHLMDFVLCQERWMAIYATELNADEKDAMPALFHRFQPHKALAHPLQELEYAYARIDAALRFILSRESSISEETVVLLRDILTWLLLDSLSTLCRPRFYTDLLLIAR
jgi:hypothetical protein